MVDVGDPHQPQLLGSYGRETLVQPVQVVGTLAYLLTVNALEIVDVSDPGQPTMRSIYQLQENTGALYVTDGFAYLAGAPGATSAHLQVLDVHDAASPIARGSVRVTDLGSVRDIQVRDGVAYLTGYDFSASGLFIIDVGDPDNPALLGKATIGSTHETYAVSRVQVEGTWAYFALHGWGFAVVDIRNPAMPDSRFITAVETDWINDLSIADDLIYAADHNGGLRIVRVDPDRL